MKAGIVTLHNYNYGSALQAYATQEYLKNRGIENEVVDIAGSINPLARLSIIWELAVLCITNPLEFGKIYKHFKSQRAKNLTLTEASVRSIDCFSRTRLNRQVYTESHLRKIADTKAFDVFLSGSDQVWNGSRISEYEKYFLRFAPHEKRVAWAASFGGRTIEKYNRRRYKRFISEYARISVREKSGVDLVKRLTGKESFQLSDPVILLKADEWRKHFTDAKTTRRYILSFYIDKPSDRAQLAIKELQKQTGYEVYTFGYEHEELDAKHFDGGPFDFLRFIDGAAYVLTDSFHSVAFATLFHTPFYAFERQYSHAQKQSTRLTDFLSEVGLIERFEGEVKTDEEPSFERADCYFEQKRKEADYFLAEVIGEKYNISQKPRMVQENKSDCCGCGACKDACSHQAITMVADEAGAYYPAIDSKRCVDCGLCQKVCSFKPIDVSVRDGKSYVGASMDAILTKHSASGGVFAQIAKHVLDDGGFVYGAALAVREGIIECRHQKVTSADELWRIQGSKYVQSSTAGVFPDIKRELQQGRTVLFGGTSCQVAALKGYLRKKYDNLITTDLICHGVPPVQLLQEYADMLARCYGETISDVKFRVRSHIGQPYQFTITTKNQQGENKEHSVGLRESAYYRLFMGRAGYRPSCYACPFATIHKPADITLGDYYLTVQDCATKRFVALEPAEMLSSVIIHNAKGQSVIDELRDKLLVHEIMIGEMVEGHEQLKWPSMMTRAGDSLYAVYKEGGMAALQRAIDMRNRILYFPRKLIKMLKGET